MISKDFTAITQDSGTVNNIRLYAGFRKRFLNYNSLTVLTSLPALCLNIELENLNWVCVFSRALLQRHNRKLSNHTINCVNIREIQFLSISFKRVIKTIQKTPIVQ